MAPVTSLAGATEQALATALGYGVGVGLAAALTPEIILAAQERWSTDPSKAVEPGEAAQIVAEAVELLDWGRSEAVKNGIDGDRFDALVGEVLNAPGFSELLETWRRDLIGDGDFEHGLRKSKLETRWDAPLKALKDRLLSVELLATARQQGFVTPERQHSESALQGVDAERAEIMFEVVGLPPGHAEAQQAANRGLANRDLFDQIIREGHTKTKYSDLLFAMRRHLLTPTQYVEGHLRGWIDEPAMTSGAGLSGMEPGDVDILFKLSGRPIPEHQVTTGEARGGTYNGDTSQIPEAFLRALEQGSLRPEWYNLAYHNRYSYSLPLWLRSLLQSGALTEAEGEQILLELGNRPDLAKKIAAHFATTTGAKADPHVSKAETQLWSALHKSYVDDETDDARATDTLAALSVTATAVPEVLRLWQLERQIVRSSLSAKEIKKAVGLPGKDRAWALARLEELGYTADDAGTLLDE